MSKYTKCQSYMGLCIEHIFSYSELKAFFSLFFILKLNIKQNIHNLNILEKLWNITCKYCFFIQTSNLYFDWKMYISFHFNPYLFHMFHYVTVNIGLFPHIVWSHYEQVNQLWLILLSTFPWIQRTRFLMLIKFVYLQAYHKLYIGTNFTEFIKKFKQNLKYI